MLLGKLATPATKVYQVDALKTETASADYLVVGTNKYVIGEHDVQFEVRFGNIVVENDKERFDIVLRHPLTMSQEELATWGIDDSIVLDLVAQKINNSIVEKVQKDFSHTY
jgi:hypothetical protein